MNIMKATLGKMKGKAAKGSATAIQVDFPQENEAVSATNYTFRISAGEGLRQVEVSVNGEAWQGCRSSAGYWWFDWQVPGSGSCILLARGLTEAGAHVVSRRRHFKVCL